MELLNIISWKIALHHCHMRKMCFYTSLNWMQQVREKIQLETCVEREAWKKRKLEDSLRGRSREVVWRSTIGNRNQFDWRSNPLKKHRGRLEPKEKSSLLEKKQQVNAFFLWRIVHVEEYCLKSLEVSRNLFSYENWSRLYYICGGLYVFAKQIPTVVEKKND